MADASLMEVTYSGSDQHGRRVTNGGAEGQRLFYTLTVADDKYDMALQAIRTFFKPKVNVVAELYRFRQRGQRHGETTDQYVAALKELAATCEFGSMEEEMMRDQLSQSLAK
ncbi:hypothetical protein QQF64_012180 [Cirrhinus molitorella]|uniref:Retrotransposon gag domain-containing protein n=1 Tax=Cirrhinus molitorella TaxID=172907 RepID=A0ABR3LVW9_9TELE